MITSSERLGRAAAADGYDATDYTRSHTANSFVPYYAQRISSACVMHGANSILIQLRNAAGQLLNQGPARRKWASIDAGARRHSPRAAA